MSKCKSQMASAAESIESPHRIAATLNRVTAFESVPLPLRFRFGVVVDAQLLTRTNIPQCVYTPSHETSLLLGNQSVPSERRMLSSQVQRNAPDLYIWS